MTNPTEAPDETPVTPIPPIEVVSEEVVTGRADGGVDERWVEAVETYDDGATGSRLMVRDEE